MAERKEELMSHLIWVKEECEKASLKLIIKTKQKSKIMASAPITSWQIKGKKVETVTESFALLGL